jgi:hypothetical protein
VFPLIRLPKVHQALIVSCKTRYNIRRLADEIYAVAAKLKIGASGDLLLEQTVPGIYFLLEQEVAELVTDRRLKGKEPVLQWGHFRKIVEDALDAKHHRKFRDLAEFQTAVSFLHENGVLLHYEDVTLRELVFLDPQW